MDPTSDEKQTAAFDFHLFDDDQSALRGPGLADWDSALVDLLLGARAPGW